VAGAPNHRAVPAKSRLRHHGIYWRIRAMPASVIAGVYPFKFCELMLLNVKTIPTQSRFIFGSQWHLI
jgi:hypothetical protein